MSTSRSRSRSRSPEQKDPTRVAAGLKAAVHNPRVKPETKQRDMERLQEMGEQPPEEMVNAESNEDMALANTIRGYKATLKNPRVSDEAKRHAEQVLREHGEL